MKLDIGCGPNKKDGFYGVDKIDFPGVDFVGNIVDFLFSTSSESVEEIYCNHVLEHLYPSDRINFFNQIYRVMIAGATAKIRCPYYTDAAAYGDPTHIWPPISEFTFMYLNENWRKENAPHTLFFCNFDINTTVFNTHGITEIKCVLTKI